MTEADRLQARGLAFAAALDRAALTFEREMSGVWTRFGAHAEVLIDQAAPTPAGLLGLKRELVTALESAGYQDAVTRTLAQTIEDLTR